MKDMLALTWRSRIMARLINVNSIVREKGDIGLEFFPTKGAVITMTKNMGEGGCP